MLLSFLLDLPYLRPFFTHEGYVSVDFIRNVATPNTWSIFFYNDQAWLVYLLFGVLIAAILAYIFGIASRWMAAIVYILALSFYNRFPLISYDGNALLIMMFFFTIFLQTDRAWSPAWWQEFRDKHNAAYAKTKLHAFLYQYFSLGDPITEPGMVPAWPARMIQINFAIVYLFAAFSKIRADAWYVNGAEVGNILMWEYATLNFHWLTQFPIINALMTWGTIMLELMFPFLVWQPATRRLALAGLLVIHLSSIMTINVTYFGEVMLAIALIFLTDADLTAAEKFWKRAQRFGNKIHKRWQRAAVPKS